jgi:tetratricopeptide (TPR) repeat protein
MATTLATIFRYITLLIFRALGDIYYWLRNEWRPPLIGLIITALIVCLLNLASNAKAEPWYQEWWAVLSAQWWTILAIYTLLMLIVWAWGARKRVVIEDFIDYTTSPSKGASRGLATLLVVRLAQLQELYRVVDEQRALSTEAKSNQAIDATIKVEDVSNFLTSAISAQSKFSLGPVEIPVGTLMSLFGRLVQGPRILGSLHKDKDVLILTAQRVGYQAAYSWRVERRLLSSTADPDTYDLDDMVNELALRMFTDLALSGSVRWRATQTFSEGLQYYRDCLRTAEGRQLKLKRAEKKFIETLGEDREFASANYNLGVLYMELKQYRAAEEAFLRAISQQPSSWRGYYALAVCRSKLGQSKLSQSNLGQFESVKSLCDLVVEPVITRKPGIANIAKVYHSWGLAQISLVRQNSSLFQSIHENIEKQRQDQQSEDEQFLELEGVIQNLDEAIRRYKKAVTFSWRALCSAEFLKKGLTRTENRVIPQRESVASVCQIDLAIAYSEQADKWKSFTCLSKNAKQQCVASKHALFAFERAKTLFKRAGVLFHYATFLTPSNTDTYLDLVRKYTDNYFNIASMYYDWGKYDEAIEEYLSALHINPDHFKCWASLALAYAAVSRTQEITLPTAAKINKAQAKVACEKALSCLSSASPDTVNDVLAAKDTMIALKDIFENIRAAYHILGEKSNEGIAREMVDLLEKYYELGGKAHRGNEQDRRAVASVVAQLSHSTAEDQTWRQVLAWLCIQVYPVLGFLSIASSSKEAKEYFDSAINSLAERSFEEIHVQGLRALLVYALLNQKEHNTALRVAEKALDLSPHGYFEWEALGDTHFTLEQFEDAIEAWQEAISRRNAFMPDLSTLYTTIMPYNLDKLGVPYQARLDGLDIPYKNIPHKIGISYRELAKYISDPIKRNNTLKQAIVYLEQAESIYEGDQQYEKRDIHYFLGFLHFELGEYHEAIAYLQIARVSDLMPLTSLFYLGYAYLKNKDYGAALKHFKLLHEKAEKEHRRRSDLVEAEYGGFMSLGEILAMAHWGIAFSDAERDIRLHQALDLIEAAQRYMDELLVLEVPVHFLANCMDCKGWILLKLGRIDKAIPLLQQAVSLSPDPQWYLHLALAYRQKLQKSRDNASLLHEIQACCQHVQELDSRREYEQQVNEILGRLQEISKQP